MELLKVTPTYVLSADIGASKSRVRLSSLSKTGRAQTIAHFEAKSGDGSELKALLSDFVRKSMTGRRGRVRTAVIGLPGMISQDRLSCAITYLDPNYYLSFQDLFDELNIEYGVILNDLECGALGVPLVSDDKLLLLSEPAGDSNHSVGSFILGMPGSGFGLGICIEAAGVVASEGGHSLAMIDPRDELELEIWNYIATSAEAARENQLPLTYSHLTRASGVTGIFHAIVKHFSKPPIRQKILAELAPVSDAEKAMVIERWAFSKSHFCGQYARDAFLYYGRFLGRAMQSVSLTILPEAIYLGGNFAMATHPLFRDSFLRSFRIHGVHAGYLTQVPLYVVLNPFLNLDGATHKAVLMASTTTGQSTQLRRPISE